MLTPMPMSVLHLMIWDRLYRFGNFLCHSHLFRSTVHFLFAFDLILLSDVLTYCFLVMSFDSSRIITFRHLTEQNLMGLIFFYGNILWGGRFLYLYRATEARGAICLLGIGSATRNERYRWSMPCCMTDEMKPPYRCVLRVDVAGICNHIHLHLHTLFSVSGFWSDVFSLLC